MLRARLALIMWYHADCRLLVAIEWGWISFSCHPADLLSPLVSTTVVPDARSLDAQISRRYLRINPSLRSAFIFSFDFTLTMKLVFHTERRFRL